MKFSSAECDRAAEELNSSSTRLDQIINSELAGIMNRVDSIYDSPAAKEMHDAHANMQRSFQSFKEAIDDCRKYLIDVVKKGYEDIENAAASKIV